ncbi:MAG: outer membrane lipoprotein carrier protein LolA [Litorimonas sp.]
MMTKFILPLLLASTAIGTAFAQSAKTIPAQAPSAKTQYAAPFTDPANVRADLARIDASMNATHSFQGDFMQVAPNGAVTRGQIWLQRPGKVRFEYADPSPLLIVSDGVTLVQNDRQLETFDRVPLSATPLNYFLKENINLAEDAEVTALQKIPGQWIVTARDGSGQQEGAITLVFDSETLALQTWIIADDFGGATRVQLSNLQYNGRIDPRKFILREDNRRDRR